MAEVHVIDQLERYRGEQPLDHASLERGFRHRIPRSLQKDRRDVDRRQMICATRRRLFQYVQWKSKQAQTTHMG